MDVLQPPVVCDSPREWILVFATWFARKRPNLSAEDVVALAIQEFKTCPDIAPEQAAARCGSHDGSGSGHPGSSSHSGHHIGTSSCATPGNR